jgi:hypothetical protein
LASGRLMVMMRIRSRCSTRTTFSLLSVTPVMLSAA